MVCQVMSSETFQVLKITNFVNYLFPNKYLNLRLYSQSIDFDNIILNSTLTQTVALMLIKHLFLFLPFVTSLKTFTFKCKKQDINFPSS